MSLKKVEQIKKDKGFRLFDLIIYGVVLAVAAITFIVVFTTRNTDPLTGVKIFVNAEEVFTYEFGGEAVFTESDTITVEEDSSGITVTLHTHGNGLNKAYINKSAKTVKMTEANCKGKDCVLYTSEMRNNSDIIFCPPHGVKIEPLQKNLESPDLEIG
ncbi:MAG: NusG domain II-containing protein [Clostridia bacterium]|nr:NusG domain II-containing protein [Clostridia bacterium]